MKIILEDLTPLNLEKIQNILITEELELEFLSPKLSALEGDCLDSELLSIKEFVSGYFNGVRCPITIEDGYKFEGLEPLEKLDLYYRAGIEINNDFFLENCDILLNSKRALGIFTALKMEWVLEIFKESGNDVAFKQNAEDRIPKYVLSEDLSGKIVNGDFFIHQGTNNWNACWFKDAIFDSNWENQLKTWSNQLRKAEDKLRPICRENYSFLIVPEKDTLARIEGKLNTNNSLLPLMYMQNLASKVDKNKFLFPILELIKIKDSPRYTIPDSHLCAEDYFTIFSLIIFDWIGGNVLNTVKANYSLIDNYGDLGIKFNKKDGKRQIVNLEGVEGDCIEVVEGDESFKDPLRNCYVKWSNSKALIKKSVLILGDSHSSVGGNPFLSYLFKNFFAEVTFYWNPCFLYDLPSTEIQQFDFVLCEISQRFVSPTCVKKN